MGQIQRTYSNIPGPSSMIPYVFKLIFKRNYNLLSLLSEWQKRYGDLVRVKIPLMGEMLITSDANLTAKVLMGTEKSNNKAIFYDRLKIVLGEGLLTSRGENWRIHRKLMAPLFKPGQFKALIEITDIESRKANAQIEKKIQHDSSIDLTSEISRLSLSITSRFLFSMDLSLDGNLLRERTKELLKYSNTLFFSPILLPAWMPTPLNRSLKKITRYFDHISGNVIAEHRKFPEKYHDFVSELIKAKDDIEGNEFSDQDIKDQVVTMLLAGHDTTSAAVSFGILRLSHERAAVKNLHEELDRLPESYLWDEALLEACPYLDALVHEILRLHASIWILGRELKEDLISDGYLIPAGTSIQVSQYLMHRHPAYWNQPEAFIPERFMGEQAKNRHPFSFFPFGGGARTCIGMHIARAEIRIILANFFRHFEVEPISSSKIDLTPGITLAPNANLRVKLTPRTHLGLKSP